MQKEKKSSPHWSHPGFPDSKARSAHKGVLVSSKCYLFGGYLNENPEPTNDFVVQDLKTVAWTTISYKGTAPPARKHFGMALASEDGNNCIYIWGGMGGKGILLNDFWKFDTQTETWIEVQAENNGPGVRQGHSMTYFNKKIYIFGGCGVDEKKNYDDLYEFDVGKGNWEQHDADDAPSARCFHSCDAVETKKMIVFGGRGEFGSYTDVAYYFPEKRTWEHPNLGGLCPSPRYAHSTVVMEEKIFVLGGTNGHTACNDLYIFDSNRNIWSRLLCSGRLPVTRAFHSAVLYYELMVSYGGETETALASDATYILDLRRWLQSRKNYLEHEKEEYKLSHFELKATLGTGSFGRVRLCRHKKTDQHYAIKILKKRQILRTMQVDHIINEKNILKAVRHPFIVNLLGSFKDESHLYLVMEYVVGGEFFTHLRRAARGRFDDTTARFYAAQVVSVFHYLHSKDIVYRDLKPENLLISKQGYIKVTDFGFAKIVKYRTWTLCGTPEYLSPEIILAKGHGKAVDWWALGILIFEMLTGNPPYIDDTPLGIYTKILEGRLSFPRYLRQDAQSLVDSLLKADISQRLGNLRGGVDDIKNHAWFKDRLDWAALYQGTLQAPWKPEFNGDHDTQHFQPYDEDTEEVAPIDIQPDPFINF